ncbi:MAG: XdhC family protein [Hyphomonadaceae bacterium]|nr:XdhC family protein [Hyphomonadaceae bacterium]MBC6412673.1 XdhC family protein [Hyphomonadaceae bacterium]
MTANHHAHDVLGWTLKQQQSGEACALIVVTDIFGGTLRAKGAMMATTRDAACGYISAGCVDSDIITQARASLADGKRRHLVYGEGSTFKDIVLPCGGSIHVEIFPNPDSTTIQQAVASLSDREETVLTLDDVTVTCTPRLRLRIVGRVEPMTALASLSKASGFLVHGQSPDEDLGLNRFFDVFDHLTDPDLPPDAADDPWTAVVILFHDHSREPFILEQALAGPAFYIGAMGSLRAHEQRLETLRLRGVTDVQLERIHAPIGLVPAMRDAQHLAVSILAEVIKTAQDRGRL